MLIIKKFDTAREKEVIRLIQSIWPRRNTPEYQRLWKWLLLDNPYNGADGPAILVSEYDDTLAGLISGMRARLKVGNELHDCQWLVDYGTHPAFRLKGGAFELLKKVMRDSDILLSVGNPSSTYIGKRMGFTILSLPVLICVVNAKSIVAKKTGIPAIGIVVHCIWRIALRFFLAKGSGNGLNIEVVTDFDNRFDAFCRDAVASFPVAMARDSRYLRWRYRESPGHTYRILAATAANTLRGYVVTRVNEGRAGRTGTIVELLTNARDRRTRRFLLSHALQGFSKEKVDTAKCLAPSAGGFDKSLRRAGFIFGRRSMSFGVRARSAEQTDMLSNRKSWFLSAGDSDIDFYTV